MTPQDPVPDLVQQQSKTVDGTARSFFKGGMAIGLANLAKMSSLGHRNAERLMCKADERAGIKGTSSPSDDMRIDSDDIHYHIQPAEKPSLLASAFKIGAGVLLAGTGIGSAVAIPTIASGVMDMLKPPAATSRAETPKADVPTVTIGGQDYQLELGEPDKE